MRIAYVGRWDDDPPDGVAVKVRAQAAQWRRNGHEVALFGLPLVAYGAHGTSVRAIVRSILATARLRREVGRYRPDVLYVRYGLFVPSLGPLRRRFCTVVELNSRDRVESAGLGGLPRRLANEIGRRSLLPRADGLVCVSRALARDAAHLGPPVRVVSNGVRLDGLDGAAARGRDRPLAVFLTGAPMPWHGLDKLLVLARETPDWDYAVVGAEPRDLPGPLPGNVRTHPRSERESYAPILQAADVGIGSLAMHRAGLDEAGPLKVREYLAHGLPVVIAFEDTDLPETRWFVLRLPNTEDNVREGVGEIRRFLESVRGRRVARDEIAEIDLVAKERARLEFMAEVARHG